MLRVELGLMDAEEAAAAKENGVDFIALPVAMQALAMMVHPENDFVDCLTTEQLDALWRPRSSVNTWKDLNEDWPDESIYLVGPSPFSPESHFLEETVTGNVRASRPPDLSTTDVPSAINENRTALGYGWFAAHLRESELKLVEVDAGEGCLAPNSETIGSGAYPLSHPHTLYVNSDALADFEVWEFADIYVKAARELSHDAAFRHVPVSRKQYEVNLESMKKLQQ